MLELKNLTKVYKTKGGAQVRALDDVSLLFEEKGMVFLLGKSGSGKSTLLNLCGGLDNPDSGEIIIKGKSSKNFSQSDFDSYRNTFVGFVFQEYNILNEFTVEDNIALALELQGKNKNKKEVQNILAQVEMENFAKRKPNTLSGGQKQRIAIARALVKNPEIIMADEPTGALDSNTGKQVFDTLKKLSEKKLVIVVSHDREFAEIYGDRIIELKDGKVISDVTKTKIAATPSSDNISFIGEDTISIKKGADLSEADLKIVRSFLSKAQEDVLISCGKKEIKDFKKAARIDENGARESFKDTDQDSYEKKKYTPEDSKFIRSKLPARHAIRIGASSMRVKPFRLFFTIFLSFVAFTMFGLFSTLTFYDEKSVSLESYMQSGYEFIQVQKRYNVKQTNYEYNEPQYSYTYAESTLFTPDDFQTFSQKLGNVTPLLNFSTSGGSNDRSFQIINTNISQSGTSYYKNYLQNFGEITKNNIDFWQSRLLTKETDLSALQSNEIIISSYFFDSLKNYKLLEVNSSTEIRLQNYDDCIGKVLDVSTNNNSDILLTIKGVYQLDLPQKYDTLKEEKNGMDYSLINSLGNDLKYGLYQTALVSDTFYDTYISAFGIGSGNNYSFTYLNRGIAIDLAQGEELPYGSFVSMGSFYEIGKLSGDKDQPHEVFFFDEGKTSLSSNEIVLPFYIVQDILQSAANEISNTLSEMEEYDQADEFNTKFSRANEIIANGCYWDDSGNTVIPTKEEIEQAQQLIRDIIDNKDGLLDVPVSFGKIVIKTDEGSTLRNDFTIQGFYYGEIMQKYQLVFFSAADHDSIVQAINNSSDFYTKYETNYSKPADARYCALSMPLPERQDMSDLLNGERNVAADDSYYVLVSSISDNLTTVNQMIEILEQVFLWVGVVMAVFSMLLLFNFISVSITHKKKEIGILRAVGARSTDVFKIFYSESAIISFICFVLAMVASFILCNVLNTQLAPQLGAAIFVFGPYSWLFLLGIAVVTSFIATFLPVYSIAKKKPVESIRAL